MAVRKTLFLPGAGGSAQFWLPVAQRLQLDGVFLTWPGLGREQKASGIACINDLVSLVVAQMTEEVDIIAQSMGGYIAVKALLSSPGKVGRLVLVATSAGLPMTDFGASDWREDYFKEFPDASQWIAAPQPELTAELETIAVPTLLVWGDRDLISPVAVGRHLQALLPDARLHIIEGAGHDLAVTHAEPLARLIQDFR